MGHKNIISILFLLICALGAPSDRLAMEMARDGEPPTDKRIQAPPAPATEGAPGVADRVDLIRLYFVRDGKIRTEDFQKTRMGTGEPLSVEGYVCGVVAFCRDGTDARVDGREMSMIEKGADGTLHLKNFGKLEPQEPAMPVHEGTGGATAPESERFLAGGYSYFPKVRGDVLSPQTEFDIVFMAGGEALSITVRHDGFCMLRRDSRDFEPGGEAVEFRYLGTRLEQIKEQTADFELRLTAISDGVRSVEKTFGVELVDSVNIVDCESTRSAVACDGRREIWIYADAFNVETVHELTTIAAHETLHILVDTLRLARDSEVRELFADLRGYDEFSQERFGIIASGLAPPPESGESPKSGTFFAFINEGNFLEGMKGGHSHKNIEEFCVSFMHSLMFVDRFEENLRRPLAPAGSDDEPRPLALAEKEYIIDSYVRAIDVFMNALPSTDTALAQAGAFLRKSLDRAQALAKMSIPPA